VNTISSEVLEFIDTPRDLDVQESEYVRLLGYPRGHSLTDRPCELADWARSWYAENGQPWIFARSGGGLELVEQQIRLQETEFSSERLSSQLSAAEAHDAALVAVSAGKECEEKAHQCWLEGKPDEYFFLEMFGSAVVEHLITRAAGRICAWADQNRMAVLPHSSPGYTGWPITDQIKLWERISRNNGKFPGDLHVMETGMLRPKKSLLALFGLTRHPEKIQSGSRLIPCENCSLPNCQYRRAPYRYAMPQIEAVGRRQNEVIDSIEVNGEVPVLDTNARYSINPRALSKWAEERLHLEIESDGSVTAHFRYEGTTCSNFGRAILYDYHVRLASHSQNYRVAELRCAPANDDTGHTFMCEYLKDANNFMSRIAAEKPLLNRPLNDVLSWKRGFNPAGCHCETESREHKWALVFEVIHFALVHRQKTNGQKIPMLQNS
jgi:hypothetical protein